MNKKLFNIIGWTLLLGMGVSWVVFGYSNWYLLLLPLATLSFSIRDGTIKKLRKVSMPQVFLLVFALALSVGVVFGLIQFANYLINDIYELTGWIKSVTQVIAIIIALYPVKLLFGSVVYKVFGHLDDHHS